ncbi:MAG: N-6 DNA methylase [Candidatus Methanoperedens nitroreducens]|nr:N-6 DNA methylase [Candidatus Methanoperedens nitroreducens]
MVEKITKNHEVVTTEQEKKEGYIKDFISGDWVKDKPEEQVRQIYLKKLVEEYGYDAKNIKTEVSIKSGQTETKKPADIVIFDGKGFDPGTHAYIIVEVKRKDRKDGKEQLVSYVNSTTAEFAVWFNGREIAYYQRFREPRHEFIDIPDIPKQGESIEDVGKYYKKQLTAASELKSTFETIHNYIYANEGLLKDKVFNEMLKIIFIKLVDEKLPSPKCEFRITKNEMEQLEMGKGKEIINRIENLFIEVKKRYSDVFGNAEKLNLKHVTIGFVVSQLQKYSLTATPADVKGTAFQTFVYAHQRGDRGEFFTPKPILDLAVEFLNPKDFEDLIDPACGSGGFLVSTMNFIRENMRQTRPDLDEKDIAMAIKDYARPHIRGIDFNPDLARVTKMYMILNDDGHTGVFSENSLIDWNSLNETSLRAQAGIIRRESFDILMTNPPFGTKGKITSKKILEQFELGYKWEKKEGEFKKETKLQNGQVPDILFIERCLEFLKPYGRMAIVLPDGDLTNTSLDYVRNFIDKYSRIVAVVSLPPETFIHSGAGVKASVIFLQKLPETELKELKEKNYTIFTAVIEKIGYDIRGRTVFKKDENGNIIKKEVDILNHDETKQKQNLPVIDTDIPDIIERFNKFKNEEKLNW